MQFVDSGDGVQIAVYEEGNPTGPTVVLVHGWPDSHVLWDGVAPLLADRFRIVRYDNRGSGHTSAPKPASAYTMSCYADDFAAVVDAVAPGEQVHVLAHDWGSAGMWEYLARPGARDRVASFTSLSGPSADHVNRFIIGSLKRPYQPRRFAQALGQLRATVLYGWVRHTRSGSDGRPQNLRRLRHLDTENARRYTRRAGVPLARRTSPMRPTA